MSAPPLIPLADRNPGEYPLENLPKGWANAKVQFKRSNGKPVDRIEILDLRSLKSKFPSEVLDLKSKPCPRYPQEPMAMIAFKCFGLFLIVLPIYFLIYTSVHLIRLPIVAAMNCSPTAFAKQIWTLVRIPYYWIALECAALYGIFRPLEGRALFGKLERDLHGGKNRRDAVQYLKELSPFQKLCWNTLSLKEDPQTFFVGFCMQPIGKTNDQINGQPVDVQILPRV